MALRTEQIVLSVSSVVATGSFVTFAVDFSGTIKELYFKTTGAANTNGDNVFNLAKNGTNLYSSGARPKIAQGDTLGSKLGLSDAVNFGDVLTPKLETMATGGVNANLTMIIVYDDTPAGLPVNSIDFVGAWEARAQPEGDTQPVKKIIDLSGNENHLYQRLLGKTALIAANQLNGNKVFDLTPNNAWYALPDLSALSDAELYMIPKVDNDPATGDLNQLHDIGSDNNGNFYPFTDGVLYMDFGCASRQTVGNPTPSLAAYHCWNERVILSNYSAYINGGTAIYSAGVIPSYKAAPFFFRRTSGTPFHGKCAAMYIIRGGLSSGQRTAFHSYLSGWTGLTIT